MLPRAKTKCRRRGVFPSRAGSYTVEMALTLPLLFLLLMGFYDLARANLLRNMAQNAAYEAAREVIVAGCRRPTRFKRRPR